MKAITLTQPWATLVAVGVKRIETRSWSTSHRGPLAIHAAKGLADMNESDLAALCDRDPFFAALRPHISGYTAEERAADLPRGAIVAVCWLRYVFPTGEKLPLFLQGAGYHVGNVLSAEEMAFGNFAPGRHAWMLSRIINLHDPVGCRGARGLWEVPEDVRLELAAITDLAKTEDEIASDIERARRLDEEYDRNPEL